jgi:teichuronic acid biosynthesis glycosyltransferase TuaG
MSKIDSVKNVGVSVIVPVYNGELTISETILSIINQSHVPIEIIVVDDCSFDKTWSILQDLQKINSSIKLFRNEKNLGVSYSRNLGLQNSSYDFIAFCDADDIFEMEKIEKQLCFMLDHDVKFSYTGFHRFNVNLNERRTVIPPMVCTRNYLYHNTIIVTSTVMYNKKYFNQHKFKDFYYDDFVFWLDLLESVDAFGLSEPLTFYRVSKNGLSGNKFKSVIKVFKTFVILENQNYLKAIFHFVLWLKNTFMKYILKY